MGLKIVPPPNPNDPDINPPTSPNIIN
jgi:hypothetical protein